MPRQYDAPATAPVTLTSPALGIVPLSIVGANGQAAHLLDFTGFGGAAGNLGSMDSAGNLSIATSIGTAGYIAATGAVVGGQTRIGQAHGLIESLDVNGNITMTPNGSGNVSVTADIDITTAGRGLRVKEGANAKQGTATLATGTVTVANTSVTANSRIMLTAQTLSGAAAPQALSVTARVAGTSFTITSASALDTSVIAYQIFEPG